VHRCKNAARNQPKQKYERYPSNCRRDRTDVRLRLYHQPGERLWSQHGYGEHRAPPRRDTIAGVVMKLILETLHGAVVVDGLNIAR